MIEVIVRTNWETLTEFRSLPTFFPPDKSGGYAQTTLTEFFLSEQEYENKRFGFDLFKCIQLLPKQIISGGKLSKPE